MRHPAASRRRLADIRDVTDQHRGRSAHDDHGLAQVVDAGSAAQRPNRPLHRALADKAAGGVDVGGLNGVNEFVKAHSPCRHALGIDLHLELAQISAEPFNRGDAGNRQQAVLDVELREVAQRHQISGAGIRFERELKDLVEATCHA